MRALAEALGIATILVVFWDAFETLILPRRVSRRLRLARIYFRGTWELWGRTSTMFHRDRRENFLSFYGPLSLLFLVAVWAVGMILGFGFLALVISYLPVLYQSFSRREVRISMLDERAGSPPSAGELLGRRASTY